MKRAVWVRGEFKVSEKSFAWVRLRSLVKRRDWRELEELSKQRKSAISWEVRPGPSLHPYFSFDECFANVPHSLTSTKYWEQATRRSRRCIYRSARIWRLMRGSRCGSSAG